MFVAMRPFLALVIAFPLLATGALHVFGFTWTVPDAADWKIGSDDGSSVLHLLVGKEPPANVPRRPMQFAIANTRDFHAVRIDADVRPLGHSLMIVFAYRDAEHFNYAHMSIDTAVQQPHHNGIFHVYGGERVRISSEQGPQTFAQSNRWYHVALNWHGATGEVNVQVNGTDVPALHAVDLSLRSGKVGLGSFDETGDFKNVRITGPPMANLQFERRAN